MRHMPNPSHSSRFYHPHNIGWAVQIIQLLVMQSPLFPRYLVPPRSKYSPQHHVLLGSVLKHAQLDRHYEERKVYLPALWCLFTYRTTALHQEPTDRPTTATPSEADTCCRNQKNFQPFIPLEFHSESTKTCQLIPNPYHIFQLPVLVLLARPRLGLPRCFFHSTFIFSWTAWRSKMGSTVCPETIRTDSVVKQLWVSLLTKSTAAVVVRVQQPTVHLVWSFAKYIPAFTRS